MVTRDEFSVKKSPGQYQRNKSRASQNVRFTKSIVYWYYQTKKRHWRRNASSSPQSIWLPFFQFWWVLFGQVNFDVIWGYLRSLKVISEIIKPSAFLVHSLAYWMASTFLVELLFSNASSNCQWAKPKKLVAIWLTFHQIVLKVMDFNYCWNVLLLAHKNNFILQQMEIWR